MSAFDVDLFVIGGGSGGVRAARISAGYGAKVMLAEEYRVGGTCVIRGCVPKKLMVYAGRFADEFEDAAGFGWSLDKPRFDWSVLKRRRDAEVRRLEGIYDTNLARAGVAVVPERALIEDQHTVRLLGSGRSVRAKTILVAVGAHPLKEPAVPGIAHAITSNEVFELETLPERILVIGGGYIAVEFAGVFSALGSRTTLLHRGDRLLRGFDGEVRDALAEAYGRTCGSAAPSKAWTAARMACSPASTTARRSPSIRSSSPPAGARTSRGWGSTASGSRPTRLARSPSMPIRRPACPRSTQSAMSPTAPT